MAYGYSMTPMEPGGMYDSGDPEEIKRQIQAALLMRLQQQNSGMQNISGAAQGAAQRMNTGQMQPTTADEEAQFARNAPGLAQRLRNTDMRGELAQALADRNRAQMMQGAPTDNYASTQRAMAERVAAGQRSSDRRNQDSMAYRKRFAALSQPAPAKDAAEPAGWSGASVRTQLGTPSGAEMANNIQRRMAYKEKEAAARKERLDKKDELRLRRIAPLLAMQRAQAEAQARLMQAQHPVDPLKAQMAQYFQQNPQALQQYLQGMMGGGAPPGGMPGQQGQPPQNGIITPNGFIPAVTPQAPRIRTILPPGAEGPINDFGGPSFGG